MKLNFSSFKPLVIVLLINVYIILYLAKIYELPFENDSIRFTIVLILCLYILIETFKTLIIEVKMSKIQLVFLIYLIYILIIVLVREGLDSTALISTMFFPVTFLSSYFAFKKIEGMQDKVIKLQFLVLIILFCIYIYVRFVLQVSSGMVINSAYYQVLLLPFALLIINPHLRNLGILIIIMTTLFSMKRTAFIAVLISILLYKLSNRNYILSGKINVFGIFSVLIMVPALLYINKISASTFGSDIFERISTVFDDGGSGRLDIVGSILNQIKNNNFDEMMIGHGYNATTIVTGGLTAHNDFIEILFNFGIFGLLSYLAIYLILILYAYNFRKEKYKFSSAFNASLVIFFSMSISSHLIFIPTYISFLCMFWSFCICDYSSSKKSVI